jgi:enamine deaminase RidA (YjgF/YER057c/UK114 family)
MPIQTARQLCAETLIILGDFEKSSINEFNIDMTGMDRFLGCFNPHRSGEKGKHARSAVGVAALPNNMAVEIEVIVELED